MFYNLNEKNGGGGFTLVELLAVIVILAIVLAIAVPGVIKLKEKVIRNAFSSDAKMIIKAINYQIVQNVSFKPAELSEVNISEKLQISDNNYQEIEVVIDNSGTPFIKIIGKNKWDGLVVCGTLANMEVGENLVCELPFICGTPFLDGRDEEVYETVKIGDQCWFAENLRYTGNGCLEQEWICPGLDNACIKIEEDVEVFYQRYAIMNSNDGEGAVGICPEGWYIPTTGDWLMLEGTVDTVYNADNEEWNKPESFRGFDAGYHLKSKNAWNGSGNYAFNALPIGYVEIYNPQLTEVGETCGWWDSTGLGIRQLTSDSGQIGMMPSFPGIGFSVRCIKNEG